MGKRDAHHFRRHLEPFSSIPCSGLTLSVFAGSVGAGYFASLVAKEPLRSKQEMRDAIFTYEETSELYLAGNIYIGKVNSDIERKETKLENVSPIRY